MPIAFDLNISDIASLAGLPMFLFSTLLALISLGIPKRFPNRWKNSTFHVPDGIFYVMMLLAAIASAFLSYEMIVMLGSATSAVVIGVVVIVGLYCFCRYKMGKVDLSYLGTAMEDQQ